MDLDESGSMRGLGVQGQGAGQKSLSGLDGVGSSEPGGETGRLSTGNLSKSRLPSSSDSPETEGFLGCENCSFILFLCFFFEGV